MILVGGGGHSKSCIDVIEQTNKFEIIGILDHKDKFGSKVLGYKVIGDDDDMRKFKGKDTQFLITVGQLESATLRKKLFNEVLKSGNEIATVISPRAYVSKYASLGKGVIVMHDALVNADAVIGDNCIINSKSLIEHDCIIEAHCHISTSAVVNGDVHISEGTFFGSNAVSRQSVSIGPSSFVKAGSCFKGA